MNPALFLTALLLTLLAALHAADVKAFLETNCYGCHDTDAHSSSAML